MKIPVRLSIPQHEQRTFPPQGFISRIVFLRSYLDALSNLANIYYSAAGSDFIIKCGDREFPVHRCLLKQQEGYFKAMFNGQWSEANKGSNCADLTETEIDPTVIEAVLKHMYGIGIEFPHQYAALNTPENPVEAMFYVHCYAAGDYFQIPEFKEAALDPLRAHGCVSAEGCEALERKLYAEYTGLEDAEGYVEEELPKALRENGKMVLNTAPLVYSPDMDTAHDLRSLLTEVLILNFKELKAHEPRQLRELLEQAPGLSIEFNMKADLLLTAMNK